MNKAATEIFTERLKRIMKSCKLKNTHIAKAMGKDSQVIWNYFHSKTKPAWADTCNLISFLQKHIGLKINLNFLFGNSENDDLISSIQELENKLSQLQLFYNKALLENALLQEQLYKNKKKRRRKKCYLKMKQNF